MGCKYIQPDGEMCKGTPMRDTGYCYHHNPNIDEAERQRVRQLGGRTRTLVVRSPLEPIEINEPADVCRLLVDTINRVRDGSLDARIGNSLGVLSGQLLRAYELANLGDRLELFERVIIKKGR